MNRVELKGLDISCYTETLSNGLEIYLLPYENKKNYFISYATRFGSDIIDFKDKAGKKHTPPHGIAHFLEHKKFETESGVDPFTFFSESGTDANASTSFDNTQYICLGTRNFKGNLKYLLTYVNEPFFTDENVEKEKGIIAEEINMYADIPDFKLEMKLREALYKNSPRRIDIAGTVPEIDKITKQNSEILNYSIYLNKENDIEEIVYKDSNTNLVLIDNTCNPIYFPKNFLKNKKYLTLKREKPWGTLHAVYSAKDYIDGSFVVINADDFYGADSYQKASNFLDESDKENEYACISYPYQVTASKYGSVKRGVCEIEQGNIVNIVESKLTRIDDKVLAEPLIPSENFYIELNHPVSMNMFAFKKGFFKYMDDYIETFFKQDDETVLNSEIMLPVLVKEKIATSEITLKNIVTNSKWLGITYREDLEELKTSIRELIDNGDYPEDIW